VSSKRTSQDHTIISQNIIENVEEGRKFCLTLSKYTDVISMHESSDQYITCAPACWGSLELVAIMVDPVHTSRDTVTASSSRRLTPSVIAC